MVGYPLARFFAFVQVIVLTIRHIIKVCSQMSRAILLIASLIARMHGKVRSLSKSSWHLQPITDQMY